MSENWLNINNSAEDGENGTNNDENQEEQFGDLFLRLRFDENETRNPDSDSEEWARKREQPQSSSSRIPQPPLSAPIGTRSNNFSFDDDPIWLDTERFLEVERPLTSTSSLRSFNLDGDQSSSPYGRSPQDMTTPVPFSASFDSRFDAFFYNGNQEPERPQTSTSTLYSYNIDGGREEPEERLRTNDFARVRRRNVHFNESRQAKPLMEVKVDKNAALAHIKQNTAMLNQERIFLAPDGNYYRQTLQRVDMGDMPNFLSRPFHSSLYVLEDHQVQNIEQPPRPRAHSDSSGIGCGYCHALQKSDATSHTKNNCFRLHSLAPCRLCNAQGADNHTETYCPRKQPVYLDLSARMARPEHYDNGPFSALKPTESSYAEWKKKSKK